MNDAAVQEAYGASLRWYIEQGVDEVLAEAPLDRFAVKIPVVERLLQPVQAAPTFLGTSDAYGEAVRLAKEAQTLEDLKEAITKFEGIALKKTASHMVFADGNPMARVMVIGEVPEADEDRIGKPFVGAAGQLLDRILRSIHLDRSGDDPKTSVYLTNILNWRPPGNRSPSASEVELSLPFIERHIQLVAPKLLILCGGVAAQTLLARSEGVSKLRGKTQEYKVLTPDLRQDSGIIIPAIVTYHPSYLLKTPSQKKAVWGDMLDIAEKIALFT